jgi:hypothetical protein
MQAAEKFCRMINWGLQGFVDLSRRRCRPTRTWIGHFLSLGGERGAVSGTELQSPVCSHACICALARKGHASHQYYRRESRWMNTPRRVCQLI